MKKIFIVCQIWLGDIVSNVSDGGYVDRNENMLQLKEEVNFDTEQEALDYIENELKSSGRTYTVLPAYITL